MTLAPGTKRGSYEILSPLGVGGMGEVYRARDTRLRRDVAIKALPENLARDPERLARLEREARILASLNHPNIAAIYGIEDSEGSPFLVMECVEGESLASKLAVGPLPVEDALSVFLQIASGLEAAHGAGVVHRDLKPANVMIRPDGSVKVLDLGLARSMESVTSGDSSLSPTVTPAPTGTGVILGTAAYMSPEQARGRPVDKRTDVFSFGCVLYECLTGARAFPGETVSDSLLQKDPRKRLHDIADARIELEEAASAPYAPTDERLPAPLRRRSSPLLWAVIGALIGIVAVYSAGRFFGRPPTRNSPPVRASLALPAESQLSFANRPAIAVSPDGRTVIFRAVSQGVARLYRRGLNAPASEPVAGTEGGFNPFFSPDGE